MLAIGLPLGGEVRALTAATHACPTRRGPTYGLECPKNAFNVLGQTRATLQNVQCYGL